MKSLFTKLSELIV